jgi:hypothetical protein
MARLRLLFLAANPDSSLETELESLRASRAK